MKKKPNIKQVQYLMMKININTCFSQSMIIVLLFLFFSINQLSAQHILSDSYLVEPGESSMLIRWEMSGKGDYKIEYGKSKTNIREADLIFRESKHEGFLYEVNLAHLKPGTIYYYRLLNQNEDNWNSFKTFTRNQDKFTFVAMGDSRSNPDIFKKINALIAESQAGAASVESGNLKSVSLEKGHGKVENIKESPPQDRLIPTEGKAAPTPELPAPKNLNETARPENKKPFPGSTSAGKQQPYSTQINYPVIIILLIILIFLLVIYKRQKEEIQSDSLKNLQSSSSAPPPVQAELIDVDHIITHESVSLVLEKRMVRIGRDSGNEIIISREFISSLHATIEYKNGYYFLEDHRGTNGTYLNNRKVSENRPVRLKSGDTIHFAKCEFRFLMHDQAPYGETVMIRTEVE